MSQGQASGSFWTTTGGILAAIAALVTSVTGVFGLFDLGPFGRKGAPSDHYEVVSNDLSAMPGGLQRVAIPCPSGKVALGGGVAVIDVGNGDFKTLLQESAAVTEDGGASLWQVTLRNDDNVEHKATISVVCDRPPSEFGVFPQDFSVAPGSSTRTFAPCPVGKVVLRGGAVIAEEGSEDFRTVLQESAPGTADSNTKSLWQVAVRNDDQVPHALIISAGCAGKPPGYDVVGKDRSVAAGRLLRSAVPCPVGKVVLGGGALVFEQGSDFQTALQESTPWKVAGGTQSAWRITIRNNDKVAHIVGIFAVCVSG